MNFEIVSIWKGILSQYQSNYNFENNERQWNRLMKNLISNYKFDLCIFINVLWKMTHFLNIINDIWGETLKRFDTNLIVYYR